MAASGGSDSGRASGSAAAPEFVSFHADRPAVGGGAHPHTNLESDGYMQMLDLLFRSARLFHPGAVCTLLTDAATRLRLVRGPVRRVDAPIDHARLMLSRAQAQLRLVEASDFARPLVLLDSDILLNGSLRSVFAEDFDVALTWRASVDQPINGGLLLLGNHRPEAARRFFRRYVELYQERHAGDGRATWYGDQLALRDVVGLGYQQMSGTDMVEIDGCRVRLLPCATHNFSPDNRLAAIADGLADKCVLHFKGQRKRLMAPFWSTFLQPRESRWPWARLLGERARRRLQAAAQAEAAGTAGAESGDATA